MSERGRQETASFWGSVAPTDGFERFQQLVDTVDDGIYQLDAGGHFVGVNDALLEASGYVRDDLLGEHVSMLLEDADVRRFEREVQDRLDGDGTDDATFEVIVRSADGSPIRCTVRFSLLTDDGAFEGTAGIVRDAGPPHDHLASVWAADESITAVINEADVGAFVLDETATVAWIDDTAAEFFGLDRAAVVGRDKREVIEETIRDRVDDDDAFVETLLATYDDNSYVERFECLVTAGEGREARWLEHRSKPIESGQYTGGRIELYYDVTDRKRAEADLRESEYRYQSLVDAVEEYAIFLLDVDGHVTSWNEGAKRIKGYEEEDILGEHFSLFYTDDDRSAGVPDLNLATAAADHTTTDEGWRVRRDGSQFWANVTISAIRDDDGELQGFAKVTRDMTERREYERELERRKREAERELDEVFHRVSDAFYALDEEWRYTFVNERAQTLLGRSEEELLGEVAWEIFPEAVDTNLYEQYHEAMTSQQPVSFERYSDPLGIWASVTVYPSETGVSVYFQDITERKARERELERYETAFETIWDGVTILDSEGCFVLVNDAFCALTGHERDDVIGEHVTVVLDESVHEEAAELYEDVTAGSLDVATMTYDLQTSTGERVPVEARFGPYQHEDGSAGGVGVIRDISERKARNRELQQYETIVETVEDGIYVLDETYHFSAVNDAYVEMTGYTREELLGEHCSIVVGDDVSSQAATLSEHLTRGEDQGAATIEADIERADGSRMPAESRFTPLPTDDGAYRGTVGVVRDLTDRLEHQRKLEESERRYRTLVEHFPDGMVALFDDDLRYTAVGGQLLEHSPDDRSDLVNESILDRYPDDIVDAIEPHFRRALAGETTEFEVEYLDRHLHAYALPIGDGGDDGDGDSDDVGDIDAGMLVVQDITERREYQQRLEESNERLEQFAYAASHDLQEPLRMVSSYLQLIERRYGDHLDEEGTEFLEFAVDGADRMREMINGLLEYSRIETLGDPVEPTPLDPILESVLDDLHLKIEEADAEITADSLPEVMGDANQLRQVFQNLLDNALEYSGETPPEVDIGAERRGDEWVVSISDRGVGIDPDATDRVFEVFERLHTHDEHAGTGIGLALCTRIVERHGGDIWVESAPGEGSTFSFTLPTSDRPRED
ncbi:PAS domain-containing sensor histidine kinase [Natronosalvus vescus]|uniref:PAS domain-containing sensor histidine kinase n=1 Tax=Natronosalvus vescus TaxID=2953881 RepID=UPI0020902921|nr:PAS domain S-box protein [Natronosalvus vescus]